MALQASAPLIIMGVSLTAMSYISQAKNKRQIDEFSRKYETALKHNAGIVPPRTFVEPYIASHQADVLEKACEERQAAWSSPAWLSAVRPGSAADPYDINRSKPVFIQGDERIFYDASYDPPAPKDPEASRRRR